MCSASGSVLSCSRKFGCKLFIVLEMKLLIFFSHWLKAGVVSPFAWLWHFKIHIHVLDSLFTLFSSYFYSPNLVFLRLFELFSNKAVLTVTSETTQQVLQIFSWSASAGRRWCCCVQGFQNSTSQLPSCGKSLLWMCTERRTCHLDKHGSLVHRRKFDRSHSDAAVLCAGVSFSWAKPTQQPNEFF